MDSYSVVEKNAERILNLLDKDDKEIVGIYISEKSKYISTDLAKREDDKFKFGFFTIIAAIVITIVFIVVFLNRPPWNVESDICPKIPVPVISASEEEIKWYNYDSEYSHGQNDKVACVRNNLKKTYFCYQKYADDVNLPTLVEKTN